MARVDELRLLVRVARLYYEQSMRQPQIAAELGFSQATVSRLLQRALQEGVVRISVSVPPGVYPALEDALKNRYGLLDVIVADSAEDDEAQVTRDIGSAAAYYVERTIKAGEVVGISSWSATLLAMVNSMQPVRDVSGVSVVQILGGVGNPSAEVHAAHLTERLASLTGGAATLLCAPGVVGSAEACRIILADLCVRTAIAMFDRVTLAVVGIGSLEPSRLLASSGNVFSSRELSLLREQGAVGDICLRFFDRTGRPVAASLDDRVVGMSLDQLKRVRRTVGMAGGRRKFAAIRGALAGGWMHVLVTDRFTAARLLTDEASPARPIPRPTPDVGATTSWLD